MSWEPWVAVGSLIATGVSAFWAWRSHAVAERATDNAKAASERANSLQETIVTIEKKRDAEREEEQKKAQIIVSLIHAPIPGSGWITDFINLQNIGKCEASKVRLSLKKVEDEKFIKEFIFEIIAPGSNCLQGLSFISQTPPPYLVKVLWNDEFGEDRELLHTITLFE